MNCSFLKSGLGLVAYLCIASLTGCGNNPRPIASPTVLPSSGNPAVSASPSSPSPVAATPSVSPSTSPLPTASPGKTAVSKNIETRLGSGFSQTTGATVQSVNCPDAIEVKVGSRFDCTAVAENQRFTIAVELTDPTGPQFTWSTRGVVLLSRLEQFIQDQVKAKNGSSVTVKCDGKLRSANSGDTFDCAVSNPQGQSRSAKITVKDDQGRVEVNL